MNTKFIEEYYNNYNEDERLSIQSRAPEYLTTVKYIDKYLEKGVKILEIGAGTGRYSLMLAQRGYDVTAVELVKHNIDIMKSKVKKEYNISIYQGNAVDLSFLESNTYDIVLILGPMYHLYTDDDRHNALSEAIRVAKRGAVIFAAYCNNESVIYKLFSRGKIKDYKKDIDDDFRCKHRDEYVFDMYRKEDIDRLISSFSVKRLHYIGADMIRFFLKEAIDNFNKDEFDYYMKYHYHICEREDIVGLSEHILDVFTKV